MTRFRPLREDGTPVSVAVVIPCHNEATSVATVVSGFRSSLPFAEIFVYDNASTDATASLAAQAGATVRHEPRKGKGEVVRRMFADVDADVYVIVDGDATYDPTDAPVMVDRLLDDRLDMIIGARVSAGRGGEYRKGHTTGNAAFTAAVRSLFGGDFSDVFSGYRVMSRRFVKSLPVFSSGFEIETELSAHAERIKASTAELPSAYGSRDAGSTSKLNTYRDGVRIATMLLKLWEETRPLQFFGLIFALLTAVTLALGLPVVDEYGHTGYVARFPTAILAVSLQIVAILALAAGVILRSVGHARDEARRLAYLAMEPPPRRLSVPPPAPTDLREIRPASGIPTDLPHR